MKNKIIILAAFFMVSLQATVYISNNGVIQTTVPGQVCKLAQVFLPNETQVVSRNNTTFSMILAYSVLGDPSNLNLQFDPIKVSVTSLDDGEYMVKRSRHETNPYWCLEKQNPNTRCPMEITVPGAERTFTGLDSNIFVEWHSEPDELKRTIGLLFLQNVKRAHESVNFESVD